MDKGFIVDGDFQGYTFLGSQYGEFVDQKSGEFVPYASMFVLSPNDQDSPRYKASGFKAEKLSCVNADVFKDLKPGDHIIVHKPGSRVMWVRVEN